MASDILLSQVNGGLKRVYSTGKLQDYFDVDNSVLYGESKFVKEFAIGESFVWEVILGYEQNWARPGTADGITTYGDGTGTVLKQATADGYRAILSTRLTEKQIARSLSTKGAFQPFMDLVYGTLYSQGVDAMEEQMLHGQRPRGKATSSANASATSTVVTFTTNFFAAGLWFFKQNGFISFFSTGSATAVGTDANKYQITAIGEDAGTLTVTGTAQDITDLDNFLAGATDADVWPYGALNSDGTWNEAAGLAKMANNTGTLFGIDASTNIMWNGMQKTSFGTLSFAAFMAQLNAYASRRFRGDLNAILSPRQWQVMQSEQAALRKYDASYTVGKAENGFDAIKYHSQTGIVNLISHPAQLDDQIVIYPKGSLSRIGAQDLTMKHAGGTSMLIKSSENDSYRACLYNDQATIAKTMIYFKLISGVTFS